jgi:predicted signal transduction protein with EAL and GGDEF domain
MEAALLARRIAAAISIPYVLDDARVEIATSIGIAVAPDDGIESEDLLRAADGALYDCKRRGRGLFAFCDPPIDPALRSCVAV